MRSMRSMHWDLCLSDRAAVPQCLSASVTRASPAHVFLGYSALVFNSTAEKQMNCH
jgi:hypothetical protein